MEEQQYMLRCKDFYERIGISIQNIIKQEEFIDVTIACDGKLFKAHKMILSACSPYFKKILQQIPCQHPVILLQNVEEKHMKNILTFIYHGEVNIDLNSLDAFLKTAKFLQVEGLAEIQNTWKGEKYKQFTQRNLDTKIQEVRNSLPKTINKDEVEITPKIKTEVIEPNEETFTIESDEEEIEQPAAIKIKTENRSQPSPSSSSHDSMHSNQSNSLPSSPRLPNSPQTSTSTPHSSQKFPPSNITQIIQPVPCPICKIQQKNKYYLKCHLIKHHGEAGKPYLRFVVPSECNPKPVVVTPNEFSCPFCNEKYHTKRDMNAHILTVHQKENYSDMKCSICDKVFSSVSNRNQHVLRYHAKVLD